MKGGLVVICYSHRAQGRVVAGPIPAGVKNLNCD